MWYAASLFFEGVHQTPSPLESLWEESIVLIEAVDLDAAQVFAEVIGKNGEHAYQVTEPIPHVLRWQFARVERVFEITPDELAHGVEVFARFLRASEAESILKPIRST